MINEGGQATREGKHIQLERKMKELESKVEQIENLFDTLTGQLKPQVNEGAKINPNVRCWSEVYNSLPDRISTATDRLEKFRSQLAEMLV